MRSLKTIAKDAGLALGLNITGSTDKAEVLDLIKSLRPMDCGKDLIRIGGKGDGGYLVPDDLEGIEYCFSPGVSTTVDFETHLAALNIKSFLADYSVDSPPIQRPEFIFDKKFLGADDNDTFFTLKSWKDKYLPGYMGELLLQMDIEGFEYEVIICTPAEVLSSFRIMVIEFHFLDRLFDSFVHKIVSKPCFEKILNHFYVAHIHPNNCCGSVRTRGLEIPRALEFTFYNKNRVTVAKDKQEFPHPLDRDNVVGNRPLHLPKAWYSRVLSG
jgi:hypothetical protein